MKGNDVLFGEGQDDDLIGGYGDDWISGGTGDDGAIGDDGRISTSRNNATFGEPLYGVAPLLATDPDPKNNDGNVLNEFIYTPGQIQTATINVEGVLKKSVNLTPFNVDPLEDPLFRPPAATTTSSSAASATTGCTAARATTRCRAPRRWSSPTRRATTRPASCGPVRIDYGHPVNPGDVLRFNPDDRRLALRPHAARRRVRALRRVQPAPHDPLQPRRLGLGRLPDLLDQRAHLHRDRADADRPVLPQQRQRRGLPRPRLRRLPAQRRLPAPNVARSDGDDALFGDLGNDWLVGGTGRDDLYGGYGNDLLSADDELATHGNLNDQPDTHPSYEDRAYGGAGRDVLIGNTGGDRLIDWVGEFNSYLVPFAPFGMATVSRTLQPQLAEFLYALSESDGVDMTRQPDTGNLPAFRNGEPDGELGVVRQQDFDWHDQTGGPADPQAGNLPGGKRDVLRTASFDDGTLQGFAVDTGAWTVATGRLRSPPPRSAPTPPRYSTCRTTCRLLRGPGVDQRHQADRRLEGQRLRHLRLREPERRSSSPASTSRPTSS